MRIALITLAVAALAFIGSIIWIFAQKNGINLMPSNTNTIKISSEATNLEILRSQWKTEDRIKELEAKIDKLTGNSSQDVSTGTIAPSNTPATPSSNTSTPPTIVPISAKFLGYIIQKVSLTLTGNTDGIYGTHAFDSSEYSTYQDSKYGLTIIATRTPYITWLKNWKSIDPTVYTVNETKTFPFTSFFLNRVKPDNIVRIVMQVESQTLLISIEKKKFEEFKKLMTKK
jgi:hypothetical protein